MLSHYHGARNEGWVWASGLTLATSTGVLRIAADEHYLTDVVAGAAAGARRGLPDPADPPSRRCGAGPAGRARARPPTVFSLPLRLPGLGGQCTVRAGVGSASSR